jgi:hypothetical protein
LVAEGNRERDGDGDAGGVTNLTDGAHGNAHSGQSPKEITMRDRVFRAMATPADVRLYDATPPELRQRLRNAWRYDEGEPLRETAERLRMLDAADRRDEARAIRHRGGR